MEIVKLQKFDKKIFNLWMNIFLQRTSNCCPLYIVSFFIYFDIQMEDIEFENATHESRDTRTGGECKK